MSVIVCGDVLDVLRGLPDEQFNCCVTSPPYWGLRDYGSDPVVWGGDPTHAHVWGPQVVVNATNHVDKRRWNHARNGRGEEQPVEKRPGWKRQDIAQGAFCECGAWCGNLGLEPTPELFVSHIVEVFREVRRVLREDGTLWLNLGDSYATGGGKVGDCPGGDKQGARYRGDHGRDPKAVGIGPQTQPNRMPLEGLKPKDLVGVPWRVAFALQADGWYLRSDIIWHKPNPMPESVTDRPTKAHEYLFLLAKSERYYYNAEAIKEATTGSAHDRGEGVNPKAKAFGPNSHARRDHDPAHQTEGRIRAKQNRSFSAAVTSVVKSRNKRSVWTISTQPYPEAHFATFPEDLVRPCILAGCPPGGRVLDPFAGSGTTLSVAAALQCAGVGIELNPEYCKLAEKRLAQEVLPLEVAQ